MNFVKMIEIYNSSEDKANVRFKLLKDFPYEMELLSNMNNWFYNEQLPVKLFIILNGLKEYPKCKCGREIKRFNKTEFKFIETCTEKTCEYRKENNAMRKKDYCLKKYGVENQFQRNEVKEKIRIIHDEKTDEEKKTIKQKREETNFKKYGTKTPAENKIIQHKIENTNLKRYGMKTVLENTEKIKKAVNDKFGVDNVMKDNSIKTKMINTTLEKYNGIGLGSDKIKKKFTETMIEKFDVENPMFVDDIKNKVIKTNLERYGVKSILLLPDIRNKVNISWQYKMQSKIQNFHSVKPLFDFDLEYKGVYNEYNWECLDCSTTFSSDLSDGKYPKCPKCFPYSKSKEELNIKHFIENLGFDVKHNKKPFGNYEIDLLIESAKLAIEYNGLYWHSESKLTNKNYHLNKTNDVEKHNYSLFHIYEHKWLEKPEIIMSMIKNKLNITESKIFARKCTIKSINTKMKNNFLNTTHIQGEDKSKIKLGLFYEKDLVAVMTFGKPRFNKNYSWELIRFSTKLNTNVVGGMSKLLTHFIKKYNPKDLITYADRSYSSGNSYEKIGFKKIKITKPNFWVIGDSITGADHRINWQKHKLKNKLKIYNEHLTAWENLLNNGYDRIWDSGNYVFEMKFQK